MTSLMSAIALLIVCAYSTPVDGLQNGHGPKPAAFILAGDSTTKSDGGWGYGFLNFTVKSPAIGTNYAKSGATTASFKAEGIWDQVKSAVNASRETNNVFVTIQFGHNDQKPENNVTLAQYTANLAQFAQEVSELGGTPILVTSLTRRNFAGSPPAVIEDLTAWVNATLAVAYEKRARWIDLNRASVNYVNAIGPNASWTYNLSPSDHTHLNEHGSVVFGRLVSDLLATKYRDIQEWTSPNKTLSDLIKDGLPA